MINNKIIFRGIVWQYSLCQELFSNIIYRTMFNKIQYRITQQQLLLIYYVIFFRILYLFFDLNIMEMEMSHKNFYRMFEDVEKMKYEFDYKILNCCLTSQRLLIIGPDKIICEKRE